MDLKGLQSTLLTVSTTAVNRKTGQRAAVKIEDSDGRAGATIQKEVTVLSVMANRAKFPKLWASGVVHDSRYIMVDLLGKSLQYHFNRLDKRFSVQTAALLGIQILNRLEVLHPSYIWT